MIIRATKNGLMQRLLTIACAGFFSAGIAAAKPDIAIENQIAPHVIDRFERKHRLVRQTDAHRLHQSLVEIRDVARGSGSRAARKGQLTAKRHELSKLKATIDARLANWEPPARSWADNGFPARQRALRQAVNERFRQLDKALVDAIEADTASLGGKLARLGTLTEDLKPPRRESISSEPMPTERWKQPAPSRILPASESLPAYLTDNASELDVLQWVLLPLIGEAHAAPPGLPSEAASCGYTGADLAADGIDVQMSADVHALAKELGYSPARIFEYVANEIDYEPYYGSLKGALGTLKSGAGGGTDQASLLIALLRASNVPARYVRGNIWVVDPSDLGAEGRAAKWLGTKTAAAAAAVLSQGEHPVTGTLSGNRGVTLSHVWVEACVPYANYRGNAQDTAGYRWIPLDPSFEQSDYQAGISVSTAFDYNGYLAARSNEPVEEAFARQVAEDLAVSNPESTLNDVPYSGEKRDWQIEVLPAGLPYEVDIFTDWSNSASPQTAVLPAGHRYRLTASVNSGDVTVDLPMPSIVHDRITLSFSGATAGDQVQLDAWLSDGNPDSSAPCSVNVVPVIKVEGVVNATGSAEVGLCSLNNQLDMAVVMDESRNPSEPVNDTGFDSIEAASFYALHASAFQWSDDHLADRTKQLNDAVQANADPNLNLEATQGELLNIAGLYYFRQVADSAREIGGFKEGSGRRGHDLGITAARAKVEYIFDLPLAVYREGLLIDMPGLNSRNVDLSTGQLDFDTFLLGGYAGSMHESIIWQQMSRLDAVSTVRGLQFANETGIEVLTLTSANWAAESTKLTSNSDPSLNYSAARVNNIKTAYIDQGYEVTLPRSQILYNNWQGEVFVAALNNLPTEAKAGYIISGDYAGGITTGQPAATSTYDPVLDTGFNSPAPTASGEPFNATSLDNGYNSNVTHAGDPVNVATGNFYTTELDFAIEGRGNLPLVFERTYNSRDPIDGPLGYGWTHSFNHHLGFDDDNFNGTTDAGDSDGVTSTVSWYDDTGGRKHFSVSGLAGGIASGSLFGNPPGVFVRAERAADGSYRVRLRNGVTYVFENVAGTVGQQARLTAITDRNGNTISLFYDATGLDRIVDTAGRTLDVTNAGGRIQRISDWTGREWEYVYDGNGDLVEVRDPLTGSTPGHGPRAYSYYSSSDGVMLAHRIASFTRPRGNGMVFEYYPNGKVFRHTDTEGGVTTFSYDLFRRQTVVTNPRGHKRRFLFNEDGNLIGLEEEGGGISSYRYEETDPMLRTTAVNPLGHHTNYSYDANGNVTQVTQPSGATVNYSDFTAFNKPQKVRDARGNWSLLQYDANGNLTNEIHLRAGVDASSLSVAGYDPQASAIDVLAWTRHRYDSYGNRTETQRMRDIAAAEGPVSTTTYDADGLYPIEIQRCIRTNRDGTTGTVCDTASISHDPLGRLTEGVDADFEIVHFEYDALGRITRGTDAVGRLRDYTYDANDNLVLERLMVDGVQLDERAETYDQLDRMSTHLDAGGHLMRYQYDANGNLLQISDPDGYTLGFDYDADNDWIRAYDKEGHSVERGLDDLGRPRVIIDPNGNRQRFHYYGAIENGRLERQCQVLDGGGQRCTHFAYDAEGLVTELTEFHASIEAQTTYSQYDALGRVIRVAEPAVDDPAFGLVYPVTCYQYDPLSNVTRVDAGHTVNPAGGSCATDSVQLQASYEVDDLGNRLSETDALGRTWRYRYDKHGNPIYAEDPDNRVQAATFDYGGLITRRTVTQGGQTHATVWERNPLGQSTRVTVPEVSYRYAYDTAHRLIQRADSRGNVSLDYEWSPGGLLDGTEDSHGNRTDYLYDPVGRLIGLWAPNDDAFSFTHDAGGRLTEISYPNGLTASYDWNADNTLAELKHRVGASDANLVFGHQYSYDAAGRRDQLVETIGGNTYTLDYQYDAGSRLTRVDENAGLVGQYTYDRFGNRVTEHDGTNTLSYQYDAAHQLETVSQGSTPQTAYLYDAAGNLIQHCAGTGVSRPSDTSCTGSEQTLYSYDPLARMAGVTRSGANPLSESYAYGPNDRRIQKNGIDYLYDGSQIHAEYANGWSDPSAVTSHGPGIDRPLLRAGLSGGVFNQAGYYHADLLGSVLAYSGAAVPIVNLAREPGSTITATNTWANQPPSLLVDGNQVDTSQPEVWIANTQSDIDVTFAQSHVVNRVVLHTSNFFDPAVYRPSDLTVYAKDAQGQWQQQAQISGNTDQVIDIGFNAVETTAIRVRITAPASGNVTLATELEIYNASGAAVTQRFDAWGNVTASSGSIPHYGYTGREPDDSGLIYYRARYYDPRIGRFTQRDPLGSIDGVNRYAYALNAPVNFVDPWGLGAENPTGGSQPHLSGWQLFKAGLTSLSLGEALHLGLDGIAMSEIPIVSQGAGVISAGVSAAQGDMTGATLSLAGALPVVGSAGDAGKLAMWGAKITDKVGDVTKGGSTTLYRAVSKAELDDIAANGLRTIPGGYETGKLFATSLDDAARFGKNNFKLDGVPNHLIKVDVPNSVMKEATNFTADGMKAVSIPANQLNKLGSMPFNYSPLVK